MALEAAAREALLHGRGSFFFEHRRWVHPPFFAAAMALPGPAPWGLAAGAALVAVYVGVRLWTCRYMAGAARVHRRKALQERELLTAGPFARVRNPLYVANAAGLAGVCLLLCPPWLAAAALVVTLAWYRAVVAWEEQVLAMLYPQAYPAYRAMVPRFVPRLGPPDPALVGSGSPDYPWRKVIRRERGALVIVAVAAVVALFKAGWLTL